MKNPIFLLLVVALVVWVAAVAVEAHQERIRCQNPGCHWRGTDQPPETAEVECVCGK